MKILKHLIEKADDTLEEVFEYAEKALHYKADHKAVADAYIKIADMHINIYEMLHREMVNLIEESKRNGSNPPHEMQVIWDYEHEKLIEEFAEAKTLIEEYKKDRY
jgi:hypothetical protein